MLDNVCKDVIKAPQVYACPELGTAQPQLVYIIVTIYVVYNTPHHKHSKYWVKTGLCHLHVLGGVSGVGYFTQTHECLI